VNPERLAHCALLTGARAITVGVAAAAPDHVLATDTGHLSRMLFPMTAASRRKAKIAATLGNQADDFRDVRLLRFVQVVVGQPNTCSLSRSAVQAPAPNRKEVTARWAS
jgi:hypothetical protein